MYSSSVSMLFFTTLALVYAQEEYFQGLCQPEKTPPMENFNAKSFAGDWYIIQRYERTPAMDCVKEKYEWIQTDVIAGHPHGMFVVKSESRNLQQNDVQIVKHDLPQTYNSKGKAQFFHPEIGWPYWILDTDYTRYAVAWSCWDEDSKDQNKHIERVTILARDWRFDTNSVNTLQTTLNKFDRSKLKTIVQDDKRCGNPNSGNGGNEDDSGMSNTVSFVLVILTSFMLRIA